MKILSQAGEFIHHGEAQYLRTNSINHYTKLVFGHVKNKCNKVADGLGHFAVNIETQGN